MRVEGKTTIQEEAIREELNMEREGKVTREKEPSMVMKCIIVELLDISGKMILASGTDKVMACSVLVVVLVCCFIATK